VTIRSLTSDDRDCLTDFTCARLGEPWGEAVQHAIRNDLVDQVEKGDVSAVGLFDQDGLLCGVAAWRISDVMPPILCRADIVAVAVGQQGKGYGRALKEALNVRAAGAGAVAVSSVVHRHNTAMININRKLGAVVEDSPDDPDHCVCIIGPL
jgi:ribosomal protein S18 acetylase RimI-like enzyme